MMQFHDELPVALLDQAAKLLKARHPHGQVSFLCIRNSQRYYARFDWPGVVVVSHQNSGEIAARSRPGRPTELAETFLGGTSHANA